MDLSSEKHYLTNIAFDSVIFGFSGKNLKILIMEYHDTGLFALPGGFVKRSESLSDAVKRAVRERTGIHNIYLEQFHAFGSLERSDPLGMKKIMEANGITPDESHWILDRFISIAYYALINYENVEPKPDFLSDSIEWYDVDKLPPLMQDHNKIVYMALQTLKDNLGKKLVEINLLPERFTMKELQMVYEAILGEKLRRTTFQRKMLSLEVLERHEKRYNGKAHKAPYLYSFKK
ncbi:MAG: NUDIX domain-containing protein [Bacteroidota bacterium]|nr:NUDIX domain-containing protein [Bacteroidota bacterium]